MELKLRRLINAKHEKAKSKIFETDTESCSSRTASSKWSLRTFSPQPGSDIIVGNLMIPEHSEGLLQSIPYDSVAAGKAPILSSQPVKGNGPIKLQTSRRLSSGDLSATIQDNRRILNDIREGDCIIGQREKRNTRGYSAKDITPPTPALSFSQSYTEAFQSPRTPPETPAFPPSPDVNTHEETPFHWSSRVGRNGPGAATSSVTSFQTRFSHLNVSDADLSTDRRSGCPSTVTSPSLHVKGEHNATIAALWKAEYSRLVEIYGRDGVERRMPNPYANAETRSASTIGASQDGSPSGITLEPLPYPVIEKNEFHARRLSNVSTMSSACHDDQSDASSNKRASLISSCAGSSLCTTQTAATDHDSVMTREDIHKIVNEMRSNYLRALDQDAPPSARPSQPIRKKRRAKPGLLTVKPPPGLLLTANQPILHGNYTNITAHPRKRQPMIRTTSHPVISFGHLSPTEVWSPSYERRPTARLQRADSTTLGSITARIRKEEGGAEEVPDLPRNTKQLRRTCIPVTPGRPENSMSQTVIQFESNLI